MRDAALLRSLGADHIAYSLLLPTQPLNTLSKMTSIATALTQRLSLIDVINRCDSFPYPSDSVRLERLSFLTFIVDEIPCGRIHSSVVPHIVAFNQQNRPVFHITDTTIAFMPWLKDYESRSGAIAQMLVLCWSILTDLSLCF